MLKISWLLVISLSLIVAVLFISVCSWKFGRIFMEISEYTNPQFFTENMKDTKTLKSESDIQRVMGVEGLAERTVSVLSTMSHLPNFQIMENGEYYLSYAKLMGDDDGCLNFEKMRSTKVEFERVFRNCYATKISIPTNVVRSTLLVKTKNESLKSSRKSTKSSKGEDLRIAQVDKSKHYLLRNNKDVLKIPPLEMNKSTAWGLLSYNLPLNVQYLDKYVPKDKNEDFLDVFLSVMQETAITILTQLKPKWTRAVVNKFKGLFLNALNSARSVFEN